MEFSLNENIGITDNRVIGNNGLSCRHNKEPQMLRLLNAFRNAKPVAKYTKYYNNIRQIPDEYFKCGYYLTSRFQKNQKDSNMFDYARVTLINMDGTTNIVDLIEKSIVKIKVSNKVGKDITYTPEGSKTIDTIAKSFENDDSGFENEGKKMFLKVFPESYIEDAYKRYLDVPDDVQRRRAELEITTFERIQKLKIKFPSGFPNIHNHNNSRRYYNLLALSRENFPKAYEAYISSPGTVFCDNNYQEYSSFIQLPKDIIELDSLYFFPNDPELRQAYYWQLDSDYYKLKYALNDLIRFVRQIVIPNLVKV